MSFATKLLDLVVTQLPPTVKSVSDKSIHHSTIGSGIRNPIMSVQDKGKDSITSGPGMYAFGLLPSGLIHMIESLDFDAQSNGAAVNTWSDKSGFGRNWTQNAAPTVDKTILLNSHATVKFVALSHQQMALTAFFGASGFAGLEMYLVYKHSTDPPSDPNGAGAAITFNQNDNAASHQPFANRHMFENFGQAARGDFGIPTTNTASAFVCYNVAVAGDGSALDAWLNLENFFHVTSGYTFNQQGFVEVPGGPSPGYKLGHSIFVGFADYWFDGNIAALYVFNRRLNSSDRTLVRTYIENTWGLVLH